MACIAASSARSPREACAPAKITSTAITAGRSWRSRFSRRAYWARGSLRVPSGLSSRCTVLSSTAMTTSRGSTAADPARRAGRRSCPDRAAAPAGSSMYSASPTTTVASAITAAARRRLRTSRRARASRASASLRSVVAARGSSAWRRRQSSTAGASTSWYSSWRTAPSGSDAATGRRMRWRSECSSADSSGSARDVGELAELLRAQRDLPAARRHQEAQRRRHAASRCVVGQPVSASSRCARTIVPAPPSRRSVSTRSAVSRRRLLVPDPLHDELQVGGLDATPIAGAPPGGASSPMVTRPRRT